MANGNASANPTIEERIQAALAPAAPEPAPAPDPGEKDAQTTETVREDPERRDPELAAPAETEANERDREREDGGERSDEKPTEDETAVEIGTLAELADHVGVSVEDLYHITVPFEIGGQRSELSISEWKDKVRAGLDADAVAAQRREFAELKKASEQALEEKRQQLERSIAEAAALTESAEKRLLEEVEGTDFAALRESDPAEWAAKQQEVQQRQAQIEAAKAEVAKHWEAHGESLRAEQEAKLQEHLAREREMLLSAVPEWRDEATRESERTALREYLSVSGFTNEEIAGATDHRLIVMARKARLYDESQRKTGVAQKKVAKVGKKIVRPGTTAGKQVARADQMTTLQNRLRKSGRLDDAVAVISARRSEKG